jgi:hypothetical protein
MIIEILRHTPVWVWVLLAALLALGASQARTRELTRGRVLALPLAMLGLGLWSLAVLAGTQAMPVVAWAVAFAAAVVVTRRLREPAGARWSEADARLHLPGSWVPMFIILAIFTLKYAVGVAVALTPSLRADAAFTLGAAAAYGALNGLLLGRALALLRLTRQPLLRPATTM